MHEAEREDYEDYNSMTDFFTRRLKSSVRKIHKNLDKSSMCSPCDGAVLTVGKINDLDATIDCVKGRSYRLDEFMMDQHDPDSIAELLSGVKSRGNALHYIVIYLSPGDYHRFHSPAIHTALSRRHIAGYLSPVKPSYVNKHKDTFKNNERVNIFGEWTD